MTPHETSRPRAYSYVRFSTPEQAKGDSLRRQTEKAVKYAAEHGLILDDKLDMTDAGVSAFRGANVKMGALGDFLTLVQHGDIRPGSYLLVENVDRISRDNILDAQMVFMGIINAGITVVTLSNERAYSRESITRNQFEVFEIIMGFIRANDESAIKSQRLRGAWQGKRLKLAQGKIMTKIGPGWLRMKEDRSGFEVIEERAAVVRRIFRDTLDGIGQHPLTRSLNQEGVPVFTTVNSKPDRWHPSYVSKLLRNEAVVGRFTPTRRERTPEGKQVRVPLDTVEGYYPAVVDLDTWEKMRAMTAGRMSYSAKGGMPTNLLAGLATCPECGAAMTRLSKGRAAMRRGRLVCVKAKVGAGCTYKTVPYGAVEDTITSNAHRFLEPPSPADGLEAEWQRLLAADAGLGDAIDNIVRAISKHGSSVALLSALQENEQEQKDVRRQLAEVGEKVTASLTNMVQNTAAELVDALEVGDIAVAQAKLRSLFSRVEVDWPSGHLWFHWRHAEGETLGMLYAMPAATPEEIAEAGASIAPRAASGTTRDA